MQDAQLTPALATEIYAAFDDAQADAAASVEKASSAIFKACKCGELLATAKADARDWREWVNQNIPRIGVDVAQKYISGAKKIRAHGEIDGMNRRQLTLFFGDEQEQTADQPAQVARGNNWLLTFGKAVESFSRTLDHRPVAQWSEGERAAFKRGAEPIVKLYQEL